MTATITTALKTPIAAISRSLLLHGERAHEDTGAFDTADANRGSRLNEVTFREDVEPLTIDGRNAGWAEIRCRMAGMIEESGAVGTGHVLGALTRLEDKAPRKSALGQNPPRQPDHQRRQHGRNGEGL